MPNVGKAMAIMRIVFFIQNPYICIVFLGLHGG